MATLGDLLDAGQAARLAALRGELAVTTASSVTPSAAPEVCRECGRLLPAMENSIGTAMENPIVPLPVFRAAPELDEDAEADR